MVARKIFAAILLLIATKMMLVGCTTCTCGESRSAKAPAVAQKPTDFPLRPVPPPPPPEKRQSDRPGLLAILEAVCRGAGWARNPLTNNDPYQW